MYAQFLKRQILTNFKYFASLCDFRRCVNWGLCQHEIQQEQECLHHQCANPWLWCGDRHQSWHGGQHHKRQISYLWHHQPEHPPVVSDWPCQVSQYVTLNQALDCLSNTFWQFVKDKCDTYSLLKWIQLENCLTICGGFVYIADFRTRPMRCCRCRW